MFHCHVNAAGASKHFVSSASSTSDAGLLSFTASVLCAIRQHVARLKWCTLSAFWVVTHVVTRAHSRTFHLIATNRLMIGERYRILNIGMIAPSALVRTAFKLRGGLETAFLD